MAGEQATLTVLLVDDDEPVRTAMSGLLVDVAQHLGLSVRVLEAGGYAAGVHRLRAEHVDLLLTDHWMPDGTGTELCAWARRHQPRALRALVTGRPHEELLEHSINRGGVWRYLRKPVGPMSLRELLTSARAVQRQGPAELLMFFDGEVSQFEERSIVDAAEQVLDDASGLRVCSVAAGSRSTVVTLTGADSVGLRAVAERVFDRSISEETPRLRKTSIRIGGRQIELLADQRYAATVSLVRDLFSVDELRGLANEVDPTRAIRNALPAGGSLAEIADQLLEAIQDRGLLRELFGAMRGHRPGRASDLQAVEALWHAPELHGGHESTDETEERSGRSHDVRNVQQVVLGAVAIMRSQGVSAEQEPLLVAIERAMSSLDGAALEGVSAVLASDCRGDREPTDSLVVETLLAEGMGGALAGSARSSGREHLLELRFPSWDDSNSGVAEGGSPQLDADLRVLLVDDHPVGRLVGRRMLMGFDPHAEVAEDGAEAVRLASIHAYDVIVMDVEMPVMDGVTATRKIREAEGAHRATIVGLTAHATASHHARFVAAGMDGVVTKPTSRENLEAGIRAALLMRHSSK